MIKNLEQIHVLYNNIIKSDDHMVVEFDDYKILIKMPNENDFKFTLFHGTSQYMLDKFSKNSDVEFTEKNKMDYKYALKVLGYLKEILIESGNKLQEANQLLIQNIEDEYNIEYTYNYMCLTTDIYTAQNYAENFNKVGELNSTILELYNYIKSLENNKIMSEIPQEYMTYINELQKAKKSDGVILIVKNLHYNSICMSESGEKISLKNIIKSVINNKKYNIHYHGPNTSDVEIIQCNKQEEKYNEYLNTFKKQLEEYRVYPLRDIEFDTEELKNKAKFYGYEFIM